LRVWFVGAGFVLLAAVLLAPALADAQGAPKRGGTIIHGLEGEPTSANPLLETGSETGTLAAHIYDSLVEQDLDFNVKPRGAEKWQISPDGKTYTFWLSKKATFSDGKPVTSADTKWTLEAASNFHPRIGRTLKGLIERIDTPDTHTMVLRLKEPFAPLLGLLATGSGSNPMILPKHVFGDGKDLKIHPANLNPVGSGPYRIKQWVRGSHIELERNPSYHRAPRPYLDRVILQFLPDAASRWLALEKGEVDYLSFYMVPLEQVAKAKANPNLVVEERGGEASGVVVELIFNTRTEMFAKKEARHAIAHAIDRQQLIKTAFLGLGKPAASIMHSGLKPFHTTQLPEYAFDVGRANKLLDAAGFPRKADGTRFKMRLVWATGREVETAAAEVIRSQLKQVGVDVELQKLDRAAAIDKVYVKWDFDAVIWSLATGPDPTLGVTRSFHTKRIEKIAFANASGYSNPEADKLMDTEYLQPNEKERAAIWHRIQRMALTDLPAYPLVEFPIANVYRKGYHNVVSHPAQTSRYLGEAWMDNPGGK
jgi:peptide/nickel transport system substrate-binding protein